MPSHKKCCKKHKDKHDGPIYAESIRTFTLSGAPQLPIVQPGGRIVFPTPTVEHKGVTYVDDDKQVGFLVPRGTYLVKWRLNPSDGATVQLLVNDQNPLAKNGYTYGQSISTTVLDVEFLVKAPLKTDNLISLINGGSTLFTLDHLPNTQIGDTSLLTQVRVQRIDKDV